VVLQIKEDFFKNDFITTPELAAIHQLFENSKKVICFHGETKNKVGKRLKEISLLSNFEQFIEVLSLFQILATSNEFTFLHDKPFENLYNNKEQLRLKVVYKFIETNYQRTISIDEIAKLTHLSNAAFCRYFKKMTRLTFTEFLNQFRIEQAKLLLKSDKNVTEASFECGFESLSYFNRIFKKVVGINPMQFKKQ
jgi:AraC-like DNA-binding protein